MVSKFMTFGKTAFGCLTLVSLISFTAISHGADDTAASSTSSTTTVQMGNAAPLTSNCNDAVAFAKGITDPAKKAAFDAKIEECYFNSMKVATQANCDKDKADFRKALGAFGSACKGLNSKEKKGLACTGALLKCNEYDGSDLENDGEDEQEDEAEGYRFNEAEAMKLYDIDKLKGQYDACPVMGREDFKEFQKEVIKAQEEVDKLENEIPELNEKIDQVQSNLAEKLTDLQKRSAEAQKEYRNGLKSIDRGKEEAAKGIMKQLMDNQATIDRIEADIRAAQQSELDAELKKNEAIKAIYLSCHNRATQEISKRRLELFAQLQDCKASKLSTGPRPSCDIVNEKNFNNALGKYGLTNWDRDQKLATEYSNKCTKAKDTRAMVQSATDAYDAFYRNAENTIASMKQQIVRVKEANQKLKSDRGCEPGTLITTDEPELCGVLKRAEQDIADLKKDANDTIGQIKAELKVANDNAAKELQTKQDALARKNAQLEREKNYLQQKRQVLALKQDASGGRNMSPEQFDKLWSTYFDLNGAASGLAGSPCCEGDTSSDCKNAREQAAAVEDSINYDGEYENGSDVVAAGGQDNSDIVSYPDLPHAITRNPYDTRKKTEINRNPYDTQKGVVEGTKKPRIGH